MSNRIIEVSGKTYQKSKVVMLPTTKAKDGNKYIFQPYDKDVLRYWVHEKEDYKIWQPHHLYFLSPEKIKEGEWQYDSHYKRVEQYFHGGTTGMSIHKIIASTDESLITDEPITGKDISYGYAKYVKEKDAYYKLLSRPSNEFLQAYCKANGKIEEVLIEVERMYMRAGKNSHLDSYQFKIAPDNTITIKPVKERVYTESEVTELFEKFVDQKYPVLYPFLKENLQ